MYEVSVCEVERIRAQIINEMQWSDEEEEEIFCCGLFNIFF